jgi:long-chain acyl-CoA synthetase
VAGHCGARVAILENRALLERWLEVRDRLPGLEKIVLMDDAASGGESNTIDGLVLLSWSELLQRGRDARQQYESRWKELDPEDPVTLIYTSGTTGPPKGVAVSHRSALWTAETLALFLEREIGLSRDDPDVRQAGGGFVSYLPLAHIAEQLFSIHLALYFASEVYCCPELTEVFDYVRQARPISFFAPPRLWEKVKVGIAAKGSEEASQTKRWIGRTAIRTGLEVVRRRQRGEALPLLLRLRHVLAERIVLSRIREALGLDQARPHPCRWTWASSLPPSAYR